MWPSFIELIVSVCIKITRGKHFGYSVATLNSLKSDDVCVFCPFKLSSNCHRVATAQGKRNLVVTFSRQGKHREFCSDRENLLTQGKYLDCDY